MKKLVAAMRERLFGGERVVLCVILQTNGSVPREAGAKMAVFSDGTSLGTVGGGAIERFSVQYAVQMLAEGRSAVRRYMLRPNGEEDIGMVCGGDVLIGFVCLRPDRPDASAVLFAWETALNTAANAWLETAIRADGNAELRVLQADIHRDAPLQEDRLVLSQTEETTVWTEPISSRYMVYIFGGGHVGLALAPALAAAGFPVTVYDERPSFAVPERFPQAVRVVCGSYEDVLNTVQIRAEDYVAVMTPGHKADFTVLCQALKTDAAYIGCIGSKKKVAFVNERLHEAGFSDADIARIHAPIGLPILAQTPEEIAVSITAQMIYYRRGGR